MTAHHLPTTAARGCAVCGGELPETTRGRRLYCGSVCEAEVRLARLRAKYLAKVGGKLERPRPARKPRHERRAGKMRLGVVDQTPRVQECGGNRIRACERVECVYNARNDAPEAQPVCCLEVANDGGVGLDEVAQILGVSRQRVHQIESEALAVVRGARLLKEFV